MRNLYIDFTNGAISSKNVKYHGGGDFSRFISKKIIEYIIQKKLDYNVKLIIPENSKELSAEEKNLFNNCNKIYCKSLLDVTFLTLDILFIPMIDSFTITIIHKLKKQNNIKIYCVLHGTRLLDVCKYDKYDRIYYSGIKSISLFLYIRRRIAGEIAKRRLKNNLPLIDRVYTVSNNSLQQINKFGKTKYIKYFTRNITEGILEETDREETCPSNKYILFVNVNRYEKNFVRSLIAFYQYKIQSGSEIVLVAVGANDEFVNKIKKLKEINWKKISDSVIFKEYVSSSELKRLYRGCYFLLYPSKSEGFGLPPLEALEVNKPTVASKLTSVPEVLGMAAYYVDPYDIRDIMRGIEYMENEENYNFYLENIYNVKMLIKERGKLDIELLLNDILNGLC